METIDRMVTNSNGNHEAQSLESGEWRNEAIAEALAAEVYCSEGEHAFLRAIRRLRPNQATLCVSFDRERVIAFFETQAADMRSVLDFTTERLYGDKRVWFTVAWYTAIWEGAQVEIAFAPGFDYKYELICIASDARQLTRLGKALDEFVIRPSGRCLRFTDRWESAPDLDREVGKVTWEDVVLPTALLAEIRESVDAFLAHRDVYKTLGFAWRRGLLLVGPPGTGKTMICKAVAASRPELPFLYVRDIRNDEDCNHRDAVKDIFARARRLAPCVLAFEDIDGLVGAEHRTVFLNELDGFTDNDGLFVIASSNHPGKIDEALLKRPSRFDRVFHIGLPELPERREFCRRLLSKESFAARCAAELDIAALAGKVAAETEGFTPAYLKEAFVSAALARAQSGESELGQAFADEVMRQVGLLGDYMRRAKNAQDWADIRPARDVVGFRS